MLVRQKKLQLIWKMLGMGGNKERDRDTDRQTHRDTEVTVGIQGRSKNRCDDDYLEKQARLLRGCPRHTHAAPVAVRLVVRTGRRALWASTASKALQCV